jgi:hypothetical protein
MSDTFYQALVPLLPLVFAVAIEACSKAFRDTRRYRIGVIVCGILFSAITYAEMERERRTAERKAAVEQRKATAEREAAVEDTSVRVAARTSATVSDVLGRQFAENVAEIRNMKKYTVASAAEVHALLAKTETGEQKRQKVKEDLNRYIGMNNFVLGSCSTVSPPGHGGSSPQVCIDSSREWKSITLGYISGGLGELYLHRFDQAGVRRGDEAPPTGIGVDTNLDPYTRSEVVWAIYELKAKADVLREFIKELGQ